MKALLWPWLVACLSLCVAVAAGAQTPVGALAIDERRGDQYGWAVDYETPAAARAAALRECGAGCSVVLTFARCGAYAADQDADSTAVGWAESFDSSAGAQQAALSECSCPRRRFGLYGPGVGLQRPGGRGGAGSEPARAATDPAGPSGGGLRPWRCVDGLFGPRTRAAIRSWQSARGARSTGYLDGSQVETLRGRGGSPPPAAAGAAATDAGGVEVVFWQSIVNSTNPADFKAYLEQFPNGVFSALARNRLGALRGTAEFTVPRGRVEYRRSRRVGLWVADLGSTRANRRERGWQRYALAAGRSVPPCSDVRQAAGRSGVLAGTLPTARVLCLESVPPAGLHSRPGPGNVQVASPRERARLGGLGTGIGRRCHRAHARMGNIDWPLRSCVRRMGASPKAVTW